MRGAFSLFYAVLFGAILSAEIAWGVFKYDKNKPEHAQSFKVFVLRVLFLICFRAGFFAILYPLLSSELDRNYWLAILQVLYSLALSVSIFGFQPTTVFSMLRSKSGGNSL